MGAVKKLPWKWTHAFLFITLLQLLWEFWDPSRDFPLFFLHFSQEVADRG